MHVYIEAIFRTGVTAALNLMLVPDGAVADGDGVAFRTSLAALTPEAHGSSGADDAAAAGEAGGGAAAAHGETELRMLRACYACKVRFKVLDHYYAQLCPECAALNFAKLNQTASLSSRVFSGNLPASVERARGHSHSVHGASNFAEMFKGPTPAPLSAPLKADKWIHFVRHCESEHIVARDAGSPSHYLIQDALLSSAGERHAETLRRDKALCNEPPELVVASPLRRTMQTAMLAFGSAGTPCVLRAELMETGLTPCDCAQPELGEALLVSHGWLSLLDEYRRLPEDWSIKGSQWRASVGERCR